MEPRDVLADDVQIGGPELPVRLRVGLGETCTGEVVGQRVDPHVHHVRGIAGYRHTPVECGPRDRQVAQTALDEVHDLVAARVRRDEIGRRVVHLEQFVLVLREPEEVRRLLGPLDGRVRLGRDAGAVLGQGGLGLGVERLVADRVPAGVGVEVDVAVRLHPSPQFLAGGMVVGIGGADEAAVGALQQIVRRLEGVGIARRELADVDALVLRGLLHLEAVLVGSRQKTHVVAIEALEARDRVGGDVFVRVPDVGCSVGVRDCRGDVEGWP
ncbi:unannotated protein [freshwater metagenome]|uniref:Unannotated protein n=1 Tax=freshwater metagenome TaxID=449393 RepID=A0A6J7HJF1_9ZZZZ